MWQMKTLRQDYAEIMMDLRKLIMIVLFHRPKDESQTISFKVKPLI